MAQQRNSGKRTGNRTASRSVVDDEDEEDDDDEMSEGDLAAQVRAALGRNSNNAEALGIGYLRDLRRERKIKRQLKRRIAELENELPEGALVLVDDEAEAIRSLIEGRKLDPKKLKELVEKLESDLATERATNLENAGKLLFSRIAETTGWNKDAIATAVTNGSYHVEEREIEVDEKGKKVKKLWPHVRPKDKKDAPLVKFDEAVERDQKYMWPALRQSAQSNGQSKPGAATAVIDNTSAPREGTSGDVNPVKAMLERDQKKATEQKRDPFAILNRVTSPATR
jgi:hypothetical protein